MQQRFMSIWFRHLTTDWFTIHQPELGKSPFVLTSKTKGRIMITAANLLAEQQGVNIGMAAADARAILPQLNVLDEPPDLIKQLLNDLGEWSIRFTPVVSIDVPSGLLLNISGCPHLWGGEREYLKTVVYKFRERGYDVRAAIADTIGAAWANARYGKVAPIVLPGAQVAALLPLPPQSLRLEPDINERLHHLGFRHIEQFINISRSALRRRFGQNLLQRIDQAIGKEQEPLIPICTPEPFEERLPCLEPIRTAPGIEIALQKLLEMLCKRLQAEGKGLRRAVLKCYRIDGKVVDAAIGTNRPTRNIPHLLRLFELQIPGIAPALGIELFILQAPITEDIPVEQEHLWAADDHDADIANLLDRIAAKLGASTIHRYLPQEHYWPERSLKLALSLNEQPATPWRTDLPRPTLLLPHPEPIQVTVPLPDYPPVLFIHNQQIHRIKKADGPERIEREWWIEHGLYRDYYYVEDESGSRYWLFRSGSYEHNDPQWYLHGYFS